MRPWILGSLLAVVSLPAAAIECIAPSADVLPVLVIGSVRSNINDLDQSQLETTIRERLTTGGKYRVVLADQYRNALANHRVDKCTPAFVLDLSIDMDRSDPGQAYGFGGFVTRFEFTAHADVNVLPDRVTLDKITLTDKADSAFTGKKARQAFDRLLENVAHEIEARRDAWVAHPVPGF